MIIIKFILLILLLRDELIFPIVLNVMLLKSLRLVDLILYFWLYISQVTGKLFNIFNFLSCPCNSMMLTLITLFFFIASNIRLKRIKNKLKCICFFLIQRYGRAFRNHVHLNFTQRRMNSSLAWIKFYRALLSFHTHTDMRCIWLLDFPACFWSRIRAPLSLSYKSRYYRRWRYRSTTRRNQF